MMAETRKKVIKRKVNWVIQLFFTFGWSAIVISSIALFNNPADALLISIFIVGLVCAVIGSIELFTEYFSSRIATVVWKRTK
jgi:hypothetical protein